MFNLACIILIQLIARLAPITFQRRVSFNLVTKPGLALSLDGLVLDFARYTPLSIILQAVINFFDASPEANEPVSLIALVAEPTEFAEISAVLESKLTGPFRGDGVSWLTLQALVSEGRILHAVAWRTYI